MMQHSIILLALIVCIRAGVPTPSPRRSPITQSPRPSPSPAATPAPSPSPFPSPWNPVPYSAPGFVFGAYIDVTEGMEWFSKVISTEVAGRIYTGPRFGFLNKPVTGVVPAGSTLTWGSASGDCGSVFASYEGGIGSDVLASKNVAQWVAAGLKYIISIGAGMQDPLAEPFTCETDAGFTKFLQLFASPSLVGVDFDTRRLAELALAKRSDLIEQYVLRAKAAMGTSPTLRWSWTLGTTGAATGDNLDSVGQTVMKYLVKYNISWKSLYINLQPSYFGAADPTKCAVVNGQCDMGQSAINAVETLHAVYGVPYNRIELTPSIGGNGKSVFSIANATAVAKYVRSHGLGGLHYLTLDRDSDATNSYGTAGTLGFANAFSAALASSPSGAATPSATSPTTTASRSPAATPARSPKATGSPSPRGIPAQSVSRSPSPSKRNPSPSRSPRFPTPSPSRQLPASRSPKPSRSPGAH